METTTSHLPERIDDIERAHNLALAEDDFRTLAAGFRRAAQGNSHNPQLADDQRNGAILLGIVAEVVGEKADEEYQSDK